MITSFLPPPPLQTDPATLLPSTSKDWMATLPAPSMDAVARTTQDARETREVARGGVYHRVDGIDRA